MYEFSNSNVLGIDITTDTEGDLVRLLPSYTPDKIHEIVVAVYRALYTIYTFVDVELVTLIIYEKDGGRKTSFYLTD